MDKLTGVQTRVNQVKEVMQQNVDQMLATHEKLEDLETKVALEEECDGGECDFGGHGEVFASFRAAPHSARNAVGGGKSKGGGEDVQALRLQSELQLQRTQQVKPVICSLADLFPYHSFGRRRSNLGARCTPRWGCSRHQQCLQALKPLHSISQRSFRHFGVRCCIAV